MTTVTVTPTAVPSADPVESATARAVALVAEHRKSVV